MHIRKCTSKHIRKCCTSWRKPKISEGKYAGNSAIGAAVSAAQKDAGASVAKVLIRKRMKSFATFAKFIRTVLALQVQPEPVSAKHSANV